MRYVKPPFAISAILMLLACTAVFGESFSLFLSAQKASYSQEEDVFLILDIENISGQTAGIDIEYLQPVENRVLFMGGSFNLSVETGEGKLGTFTNHMPPEPRPGSLKIKMEPGEKIRWKIFFPYYYYPVKTPNTFKVKAVYGDLVSNEAVVSVEAAEGKVEKGGLVVNPDFSQGSGFPCGWKLTGERTLWDKSEKLMVFHLDKAVAESEGVWVYSLLHEIKTPAELRLDAKIKSSAPEVIIFVEGWGIAGGRRRRLERNELFVHPDREMKNYTFRVIFKNPKVEWFRIKLYSYLKPGSVWFDSVDISLPGSS